MIVYNSHQASSLLRISGSVLPAAMKWAAIAGLGAFILKYLENYVMPEGMLGDLEISPAAYNGFSFTLGFVIVFRTSQCYNRFWHCMTHVNHMRAEWYEAASCLTTFIVMSPKPIEAQDMFSHKVIRYFSLLHSLALQVLVDGSETFPTIDLESFPEEALQHFREAGSDTAGLEASVELVYQWIQALIVHSMNEGLLNVPPPILTRVLQMLSSGMVHYRSVLDIISIPFPFPYAQVTFVLLTFYVCFIPIVMCLLVHEAWIAGVCGFLSVLCLITVDLVSTEIENPFGEDQNDLPCHDFQHRMNTSLISLMHPAAADPPQLGPNAKLSFAELMDAQTSIIIEHVKSGAPKFHGAGGVKPPVPPQAKPSPTKERKPKVVATQEASATSAEGGQKVQSGSLALPTEMQALGGQGNVLYGQKLTMQQTTMTQEFIQNDGAVLEVLERMNSTLDGLTTALMQKLSNLGELQTRRILPETLQRTEMDAGSTSALRNTMAGDVPVEWGSELRPTLDQQGKLFGSFALDTDTEGSKKGNSPYR